MLRAKRITPVRRRREDGSQLNPLHVHKDAFVRWTTAIGLSEQTALTRRASLDFFIRWCSTQGVRHLAELNGGIIEAYQAALACSRKANGDGLARTTQVARLNPLKAFGKWLSRTGRLKSDPFRDMILPKLGRRLPPRVPTVEEVAAILAGADGSRPSTVRDRAMMEVLYTTALRRMELVRLRSCDVNVSAGTVFVRSGKGGHDRVVPLGARAGAWIARYEQEVRPRLSSGATRPELFLTDFGEPFSRNRLGDRIRRYVARHGLPGACHIFRHACATHMLENGADIRFIQAMLGHSQLSTTQIYTRVSILKLKEIHAATHPARLAIIDRADGRQADGLLSVAARRGARLAPPRPLEAPPARRERERPRSALGSAAA